MNKRIEELAVEACLKHCPSYDNVVLYGDYAKSAYNKEIENMMCLFGELIIDKCIEICEESVVPIDIDVWRNASKKEISKLTALGVSKNIKQHFGVQ